MTDLTPEALAALTAAAAHEPDTDAPADVAASIKATA